MGQSRQRGGLLMSTSRHGATLKGPCRLAAGPKCPLVAGRAPLLATGDDACLVEGWRACLFSCATDGGLPSQLTP